MKSIIKYNIIWVICIMMGSLATAQPVYQTVYYNPTGNANFISSIAPYDNWPLGMCYEGTQNLGNWYQNNGYDVTYATTNPNSNNYHAWLLVRDPSNNGYAAIDSYYGYVPINQNNYWYYQPYATYNTFGGIQQDIPYY